MAITNWADLYAPEKLKSWNIPAYKEENLEEGIFRNPMLHWNELSGKDGDEIDIPLWQINCDVLRIDKDIFLNKSAIIFARRIEITKGVSIVLNRMEDHFNDVIIFAQEVVDSSTGEDAILKIQSVQSDEGVTVFDFGTDKEKGINGISWSTDEAEARPMDPSELDRAYFSPGDPLNMLLTTTFQLAILFSHDEIELSKAQLSWIASIAVGNKLTQDLAGQAKAMETNLRTAPVLAEHNTLLVPYLDHTIYASNAAACMKLLLYRQSKWDIIQNKEEAKQLRLDAVEDSLTIQMDQKQLADSIEKQAKETREQALDARNIAARQITGQSAKVGIAKIDFDRGIEEWRDGKIVKEVFNLVTGAVEVLMQIPAIVAGGPQLLASGSAAASAGAELAKSALEKRVTRSFKGSLNPKKLRTKVIPDRIDDDFINPYLFDNQPDFDPFLDTDRIIKDEFDIVPKEESKQYESYVALKAIKEAAAVKAENNAKKGLQKAGLGGKKIISAIQNIRGIVERAKELEYLSVEGLRTSNDSVKASFSSFYAKGLDLVTGGKQEWDNLSLEIDILFKRINEVAEIKGGLNYQLELRKLVVLGGALSQARLAMAKANAQYTETRMRRKTAEKALNVFKLRKENLEDAILDDGLVKQMIFAKMLNDKRAVYLAMESYSRAFQYFTLPDPGMIPVLPRITDSIDKFEEALTKGISNNSLTAEALKDHIPQTMVSKNIILKDSTLIDQLKNDGFLSFNLTADNKEFDEFFRVRVNNIRVFAEGLTTEANILVKFSTSGVYVDKTADRKSKKFISEPIVKNFVYSVKDDKRVIGIKADISPRYRNDFFYPTPFSTWTISISAQDQNGPPLDLSTLTALSVEFAGEASSLN